MSEPRQIAIVRSYDELHAALRARADELDVSRETLDSVSGLQAGYVSKLLAPVPIKSLGRMSLGPLLGAMGLVLVLVEDLEMLKRLRSRLVKREVGGYVRPIRPRDNKEKSAEALKEWSKIMNARRMLLLPPSVRSELARKAVKARWRKFKSSSRILST